MGYVLDSIPDKVLIDELKRRHRVSALSNTVIFFNELAGDEKYMESIDTDMVRGIARELNNKLYIDFEDVVLERDSADRPAKTERKASLLILVPEGVYDHDSGEDR